MYTTIDINEWKRKQWYESYMNNVPCSFSSVIQLDITYLYTFSKANNIKLYSSLVWSLTAAVNSIDEFRYSLMDDQLILFDNLQPSFTVLNSENETFMELWSEFQESILDFDSSMNETIAEHNSSLEMSPQSNKPINSFNISMIPWVDFTSFSLHLPKGHGYLLPIFTFGKLSKNDDRVTIPLSIQVNHAVTDGYHLGKFIKNLETVIDSFAHKKL